MKYIGDGSALPLVPARDLTEDEAKVAIEMYGEEAVAKLYEKATKKTAKGKAN